MMNGVVIVSGLGITPTATPSPTATPPVPPTATPPVPPTAPPNTPIPQTSSGIPTLGTTGTAIFVFVLAAAGFAALKLATRR